MTSAVDELIAEQSEYIRKMGLDPEKDSSWDIALNAITKTKDYVQSQ